jgi:hypothetical protein
MECTRSEEGGQGRLTGAAKRACPLTAATAEGNDNLQLVSIGCLSFDQITPLLKTEIQLRLVIDDAFA